MGEYNSKIMEHLGNPENLQVCVIGFTILFPELFTLREDQKTIQINEFKSIDQHGQMDIYFDAESNQVIVNTVYDDNWHVYKGMFLTPEQMKLDQNNENDVPKPQ